MATTIQIQNETKVRLDALKEYARQTYDELIQDLLILKEEEPLELSTDTKRAIVAARKDIKAGRVYTTKQLIRTLGL